MKIAFIGQKGIPATYGGIERWVDEVSTRLAAMGHEVTVYCRYSYSREKLKVYKGVKLVKIPSIPTKNLDTITATLLSTIHALFCGYDIIHCQALGPSTLIFIPKLFGIPVVTTIHRLDWKSPKWGAFAIRYMKFGERVSSRFSDRMMVVSPELKGYFKERYDKDAEYIPNGATLFPPDDPCISKWGLAKERYILAVGRLVPEKKFELLVEAFRSVKSGYKLVIAGGSSFSETYAESLKKTAGENVIFTGYVYGGELAALFTNAYAFVNPSEIEGMPLVVLEAAGYGCCVLLSDIEEHKGLLGGSEFYFRKNDPGDLKQKLEFLMNNPAKVKEAGQKSKEYALKHYDWDDITRRIEGVYKDVLARRHRQNK